MEKTTKKTTNGRPPRLRRRVSSGSIVRGSLKPEFPSPPQSPDGENMKSGRSRYEESGSRNSARTITPMLIRRPSSGTIRSRCYLPPFTSEWDVQESGRSRYEESGSRISERTITPMLIRRPSSGTIRSRCYSPPFTSEWDVQTGASVRGGHIGSKPSSRHRSSHSIIPPATQHRPTVFSDHSKLAIIGKRVGQS